MTHNQIILHIQLICKNSIGIPTEQVIMSWIYDIFSIYKKKVELTIRIVDLKEIKYLNWLFLKKNYPTNVLSFPFLLPLNIKSPIFGDIIICRSIVKKEAKHKNVSFRAHLAHMIIHGSLHLLGYDHILDQDAILMKQREIYILKKFGYKTCCYDINN